MNPFVQSHHNNDGTSSRRVTRLELIVALMAFILVGLLSGKIQPIAWNGNFVTHADLRDIEYTISSLQDALHSHTTRQASLISLLNDKIIQIQSHQSTSQPAQNEPKFIQNKDSLPLNVKLNSPHPRGFHFTEFFTSEWPPSVNKVTNIDIVDHDQNRDRKLQTSIFHQPEILSSRCDELPILSPSHPFNGFEYDERVDRLLSVIQTLTPADKLTDFQSPQYKAACWILFDDVMNLSATDAKFIERYTMAVFQYSMNPSFRALILRDTCHFPSLTCNRNGNIISIEISGIPRLEGFQRSIPPEISLLRFLEHLKLDNNHIVGTIPNQINRLVNLKLLDLDDNDLTGTLPTGIGRLTVLETMFLRNNKLEGSIPSEISNCQSLKFLRLTDNNMDGMIPKELFDCTHLTRLDLYLNSFTGALNTNIGQLHKLTHLRLSNNNFTGNIPSEIGRLTSLQQLWFGFNDLTGSLPSEIGNLNTLEWLVVNDNRLTGTLPDLSTHPQKNVVQLSMNQFTGTIPSSLYDHHEYFALLLFGNNLNGDVPIDFCSKVENFKVDDSDWFTNEVKVNCPCCPSEKDYIWNTDNTAIDHRPLCPFSNRNIISFFEEFYIEDNIANVSLHEFYVANTILEKELCLSPLGCYTLYDSDKSILDYDLNYSESSKTLSRQDACGSVNICGSVFDMDHPKRLGLNHLTQIAMPDISKLDDPSLPEYRTICWIMTEDSSFHDYSVSDGTLLQRYVLSLFYLSQQENLNLNEFMFKHICEWPGIMCDSENKFAEHLNLRNKHLGGTLITEIGLLTRLQTLDLNGNSFKGTIDSKIFAQMPFLEVIDLGNNNIGGEIPSSLFKLPQLKKVDLSVNSFVETLPDDIAFSPNLEFVDVHKNLLRGPIPHSMIACQKLEYIDLSANSFMNDIPPAIGSLKKLRTLKLDRNMLSGSIPIEIFGATQLEELFLQFNSLTGSIPSQIEALRDITHVSMSNNALRGKLPSELGTLRQIEALHVQGNRLTGIAPTVNLVDHRHHSAFVADCGKIDLVCDSCTMCCNPEGNCQENLLLGMSLESSGYIIASIIPLAIALYLCIVFRLKERGYLSCFRDRSSSTSIYDEDSVYCLIFSNNVLGWVLYVIIATIQTLAFYVFMKRSNFHEENSAWEYRYNCEAEDLICVNEGTSSIFGWAMLALTLIFFLGADFADSVRQLRKAANLLDLRLLLSGLVLFFLTALACFTSVMFNLAVAVSDTDLIINAVFLLFINDMDEACLKLLQSTCPQWLARRYIEIKKFMKARDGCIPDTDSESIENRTAQYLTSLSVISNRYGGTAETYRLNHPENIARTMEIVQREHAHDSGLSERHLSGLKNLGLIEDLNMGLDPR